MKSKLDVLCADCAAALVAKKQSEGSVTPPKGFDWLSIISLLLPLLTEWLSGSCLAKQSAKDVEDLISQNGIWSKIALNQCCRRLEKESKISLSRSQRDEIASTLAVKASKGELEPALNEVKDAFSIDSIWG